MELPGGGRLTVCVRTCGLETRVSGLRQASQNKLRHVSTMVAQCGTAIQRRRGDQRPRSSWLTIRLHRRGAADSTRASSVNAAERHFDHHVARCQSWRVRVHQCRCDWSVDPPTAPVGLTARPRFSTAREMSNKGSWQTSIQSI